MEQYTKDHPISAIILANSTTFTHGCICSLEHELIVLQNKTKISLLEYDASIPKFQAEGSFAPLVKFLPPLKPHTS
jgi:hypothetical protein